MPRLRGLAAPFILFSSSASGMGHTVGELILSAARTIRAERQRQISEKEIELCEDGHSVTALDIVRRSVSIGNSPTVLLAYARALRDVGNVDAALETTRIALDVDPSHPGSFELYLDLAHVSQHSSGIERKVRIENYALHVVTHDARLVDSYEYALAFSLRPVLEAMARSSNAEARALAEVDAMMSCVMDDEVTNHANEIARRHGVDARVLLFRAALTRGRHSVAGPLSRSLEADKLPLDSMRRTIRRMNRNGHLAVMRPYLVAFLRGKPADGWALRLLKEAEHMERSSASVLEREDILRNGIPCPPRSARTYIPKDGRVLYLLHNSLPYDSGGYSTRTHGLLSAMRNAGWDVHGVSRPGYPYDRDRTLGDGIEEVDRIDGVPYRRLSVRRERLPRTPFLPYLNVYENRLVDLATELRPVCIHAASNYWNGMAAVRSARRLGIPSVYEVRGLWELTRLSREKDWALSDEYRFMVKMETAAASQADAVLVLTQPLKELLTDRGVDEAKISILPNAVDCDRFKPLVPDESLRRRLGIPGVPVVGYLGSVIDYEGLDVLVHAAGVLVDRGIQFHVLIVGDGLGLPELRELVASKDLSDTISIVGRVPHHEIENYLSIVDVVALPRKPLPVTEAVSPLKPFEAMAMGKLVVASDVRAIAEFLKDGENGLLFSKGDPMSLANSLEWAFGHESEVATITETAKRWVSSERSWSGMTQIVSQVYASLGIGCSPESVQ